MLSDTLVQVRPRLLSFHAAEKGLGPKHRLVLLLECGPAQQFRGQEKLQQLLEFRQVIQFLVKRDFVHQVRLLVVEFGKSKTRAHVAQRFLPRGITLLHRVRRINLLVTVHKIQILALVLIISNHELVESQFQVLTVAYN